MLKKENDYIQAYLINFCSLYIYKMDLFILLLIIMFICCLMAEVRVEARGRGITVTGVIMKWWHEVGIDDWYTGPWISGFSLLLLFTLALTVLTKCTWSQLRYFLSIKKISILTAHKFWFIFGLRAPSPSIYTLYLKTMNVVNLETENSYKITWCWNICNSPNKLSARWCRTHKTSSWPDLPCCCGPPGRWWTMFWMSTLCSSNIWYWAVWHLLNTEDQYVTLEEILFSTSPLQKLQLLLCQQSLWHHPHILLL